MLKIPEIASKYVVVLSLLFVAACTNATENEVPEGGLLNALAPDSENSRTTQFIDNEGQVTGQISITPGPNGTLIRVDLKALPQGWHGVHLHQVGSCEDFGEGFKASGSHINPDGNKHGLLNPQGYEKADLPNIYADKDKRATAALFAQGLTEAELLDADGFAVIIHANPDDHITQPIGGAAARIACAYFE